MADTQPLSLHLLPESQPSETTLAYIAGLLDRERSISIPRPRYRGLHSYNLQVLINMTDPQRLEVCRKAFGGRIRPRKRQRANWSDYYVWQLCNRHAERLLKLVRPFLRVKANEADIGLQFMQRYWQPRGNPVTYARVAIAEDFKQELARLHPNRANLPGRPRGHPPLSQTTLI